MSVLVEGCFERRFDLESTRTETGVTCPNLIITISPSSEEEREKRKNEEREKRKKGERQEGKRRERE